MPAKKEAAPKKETAPKLIKMKQGEKTADVHPDMVAEYEKGGYVKA